MNEFARLEGVLAKLRQKERGAGEPRRLRGTDQDSRLGALVTEIDETILPRRKQESARRYEGQNAPRRAFE